MSDRTKIEWTDASWNPLRARNTRTGAVGWHCAHVTEACRNCYAEGFNNRLGTKVDYKPGALANGDVQPFLDEKILLQPLHWRKPRKIFVCSMTDLFGDWVTDEQLDRIFAVMALCPQHTFIVLTKRPERMREYVTAACTRLGLVDIADAAGRLMEDGDNAHDCVLNLDWPLSNVWLLVSICDQADADKFIPTLLDTPAAVRGVSYEPALGPVDFGFDKWVRLFSGAFDDPPTPKLDWVICGGESGPHARPMHWDWARQARDQCAAAGVPFFFKQWGEYVWGDDYPRGIGFVRVGKKRAGRLLDGVEHNGFPA